MNHIKEALKDKNGDAYIWLCVIVVFISMLLSVLILYMGLLSQVQIQKRDMKHKLDGYISDYATVAFNAVKQGEAYEVYVDYETLQTVVCHLSALHSRTRYTVMITEIAPWSNRK